MAQHLLQGQHIAAVAQVIDGKRVAESVQPGVRHTRPFAGPFDKVQDVGSVELASFSDSKQGIVRPELTCPCALRF